MKNIFFQEFSHLSEFSQSISIYTETRSSVTLAVCPGLANCSENLYIKAFALQATRLGYKVAVLNHLGVTNDPLTSPRLFTLG